MSKGRTRRSDKAIKEEVKMELTPMIDVVFLILIFFMCTLKFKTLEGKLISYLPTDQGLTAKPDEIPKEDAEVIIRVPKSEWGKEDPLTRKVQFVRGKSNEYFGESRGVVIGRNKRVAEFDLVPPDTFEKIREYLENIKRNVPDAKAKINSWSRAPHVYAVKILNMMIKAGFTGITYSGISNELTQKLQRGEVR